MQRKIYHCDIYGESRLHYSRKLKGEFIERLESGIRHNNPSPECDILSGMISYLDSEIYELENRLRDEKANARREDKERLVGHSKY